MLSVSSVVIQWAGTTLSELPQKTRRDAKTRSVFLGLLVFFVSIFPVSLVAASGFTKKRRFDQEGGVKRRDADVAERVSDDSSRETR